jgi:hypothetical protein
MSKLQISSIAAIKEGIPAKKKVNRRKRLERADLLGIKEKTVARMSRPAARREDFRERCLPHLRERGMINGLTLSSNPESKNSSNNSALPVGVGNTCFIAIDPYGFIPL